MNFLVKALTRQKRLVAYRFVEANTEQQAVDYAISHTELPTAYSYEAQLINTQNATMHKNTLNFNKIGSQFLVT